MVLLTDDKIFDAIKKLPKDKKDEVYDFIKFLLSRNKKRKKDLSKLTSVSVWDDSDIEKIENVGKEISSWNIQEY